MITIYDKKVTAHQFAVYAVCSYGAFAVEDWEDTGDLAESALVMTDAEKREVDKAIDIVSLWVLRDWNYNAVHTIVFGEGA